MENQGISREPYTSGELFCGAGGFTRGFEHNGFCSLFANDLWPAALHTFLMNFDGKFRETGGAEGQIVKLATSIEDISETQILGRVVNREGGALSLGDLDVLLGGPPCQGFSVNSHIRSAEDPRNHLFRHYIRLLKRISPKVFVLENVPGMLSLSGGEFFAELLENISLPRGGCPGYDVDFKILNAAHYGVPQDRFRIFVIGTRRDVSDAVGKVRAPSPKHYSMSQAHFRGGRDHTFHHAIGFRKRNLHQHHVELPGQLLRAPVTVSEAIGDLPPLTNGGGEEVSNYLGPVQGEETFQSMMRGTSSILHNHWCRKLAHPNIERARHIPVGGDWRSIPVALLPPGMQRAQRKDHTKRYGRFAPDDLSGTILTKPDPHWGTFLHYDVHQARLISVREAARLQSFPDHHIFYGGQVDQYKLCGNAVPPLLAREVARNVAGVLDAFYLHQAGCATRARASA